MKFNFPKKTEMESITVFLKKTTLEKIQRIADKNECTDKEVVVTLVEEAIEEYESSIGKIRPPVIYPKDKRLNLDVPDEEVITTTDNPFIRKDGSVPAKEKGNRIFCQYKYCTNKDKTHYKFDMIEHNGLVFCRQKCVDEWEAFQKM